MIEKQSFHSICRWTFHAGKGGFVPGSIRPGWTVKNLDTIGVIKLIKERIVPRIPETIQLGIELHYDFEVDDKNAPEVADGLVDSGITLAMITPGAHGHYGYGGIASLDEDERKSAEEFGIRTVDLAYGPLRKAWHPDPSKFPTFVLWNGSYGYDIASIGIQKMYESMKESVADLCRYEAKKGEKLYIGIEPKPNEGHPAMLLPTVASVILFWRKLKEQFGISIEKKGVNKEFGHSEMIGLDPVYDSVEELDNNMMVHMHLNSQGYNNGIVLGGPGKFDIDHGTRITGMNLAIAGLIRQYNYQRWKGHDMQARPYDNEERGIDRVVRSVLAWEACERAAGELDENRLLTYLAHRETAEAEDMIMAAVIRAHALFDRMIRGG